MTQRPEPERRVSVTGIALALIFLSVASVGMTGDPFWMLNEGTTWVAAAVLGLIGLGLVATTVPGLRKPR